MGSKSPLATGLHAYFSGVDIIEASVALSKLTNDVLHGCHAIFVALNPKITDVATYHEGAKRIDFLGGKTGTSAANAIANAINQVTSYKANLSKWVAGYAVLKEMLPQIATALKTFTPNKPGVEKPSVDALLSMSKKLVVWRLRVEEKHFENLEMHLKERATELVAEIAEENAFVGKSEQEIKALEKLAHELALLFPLDAEVSELINVVSQALSDNSSKDKRQELNEALAAFFRSGWRTACHRRQ